MCAIEVDPSKGKQMVDVGGGGKKGGAKHGVFG